MAEDIPEAGLLAITSPDRLHRDWRAARARGETGVAERLLAQLRPGAALVTVGDFHPATLSWLGAVAGHTIVPLGVDPEVFDTIDGTAKRSPGDTLHSEGSYNANRVAAALRLYQSYLDGTVGTARTLSNAEVADLFHL